MDNLKVLEINGLTINPSEQTVIYKEREINLSMREFQILYHLMSHQGHVFSKQEIYELVHEDRNCENYHRVEVAMSRLKGKLERSCDGDSFIVTVRERGYKFKKKR